MPFYDLACPNCGAEYVNVKHTIAEISNGVECESCKLKLNLQVKLEVIHHSPIFFQLKGEWPGKVGK